MHVIARNSVLRMLRLQRFVECPEFRLDLIDCPRLRLRPFVGELFAQVLNALGNQFGTVIGANQDIRRRAVEDPVGDGRPNTNSGFPLRVIERNAFRSQHDGHFLTDGEFATGNG